MSRTESNLTRQGILRTLRQNRDVLQRYSVRRIGLFGSHAVGEQTERSDIDFLVEFDDPTLDNFLGLCRALERLFARKVDVLTPDGLKSIRIKAVSENIRKTLAYA